MADCSRLAGEHEQRGAGCDQLELQATSLLIQTLKKTKKKKQPSFSFLCKTFWAAAAASASQPAASGRGPREGKIPRCLVLRRSFQGSPTLMEM